VDHIVNVWVLSEDFVKASLIGDINVVEGRLGARQDLNAVHDLRARGVVAIVDDDDLVASLDQGEGRE
jgi:hypothetical protein